MDGCHTSILMSCMTTHIVHLLAFRVLNVVNQLLQPVLRIQFDELILFVGETPTERACVL